MRCSTGTWTPGYPLTALWINNPTFDTDHRHRHSHRGGMLTKTPPPTELQIPATVTTLLCTSCRVDSGHVMQKQRKFYFMWSCDKGRQYQWWPQDMAFQRHDQHDMIKYRDMMRHDTIIIRKFITRTCSQALSMNRRRGHDTEILCHTPSASPISF